MNIKPKPIIMTTNIFKQLRFFKPSLIVFIVLFLVTVAVSGFSKNPNSNQEPSLEGKKVLFVYGGWEGHDPIESSILFVPWMRSEGAEVTVSNTLDSYLDEELMESLDLIVQIWTMGKISNEQEKALLDAMQRGVGIAGWHGGLADSFRNNVRYQFMVGGQWVAHPGNIINYEVNIIDKTDPITAGLRGVL